MNTIRTPDTLHQIVWRSDVRGMGNSWLYRPEFVWRQPSAYCIMHLLMEASGPSDWIERFDGESNYDDNDNDQSFQHGRPSMDLRLPHVLTLL